MAEPTAGEPDDASRSPSPTSAAAADSAADNTSPSTPLDVDGSNPPTPTPTPVPFTPVPFKRKRGRPSRAAIEERNRLSTPRGGGIAGIAGVAGIAGIGGGGADNNEDTGSEVGTPASHSTPSYSTAAATTTARGGASTSKRRGRPPAPGGGGGGSGGGGSAKTPRSRGGPSHHTQIPLDKDGNPQQVAGDEIVLDEDPLGQAKVDADGHLQGGREYRCRTFTLLGRGARLYMLSTEPARCIGFRDSYLFFQKHRQLFKIITEPAQKFDLIARDLIPHSYKGRAIGVVTARSVFREFGARIVVGGRRVADDFWEARARADESVVPGELADPLDRLPPPGEEYNRNQYVAWHGASSVYHTGQASVPGPGGPGGAAGHHHHLHHHHHHHHHGGIGGSIGGGIGSGIMGGIMGGLGGGIMGGSGAGGAGGGSAAARRGKKVVVTDVNWMAAHAAAAQAFNSGLRAFRQHNVPPGGVYEPHSNLMHVPRATQPSVCRWSVVGGGGGGVGTGEDAVIVVDEAMEHRPWVGGGLGAATDELATGFGQWDDAVIDALDSDELKGRVRAQVLLERRWAEKWG